jgi:methionyl-tRNA formyltransferase
MFKIAFMGTPDFAADALAALLNAPILQEKISITHVYAQPPRPKGRGQHLQPSPVQQLAQQHNISVRTPLSLKRDLDEVAFFQAQNFDLAIVAAYGLILPDSILNAPRLGCINIHGSLLPRWRGAAPIQHAIWSGDTETGITLMKMDTGLDTGDMIVKKSIPIHAYTTTSELYQSMADLGAKMIVDLVKHIIDHQSYNTEKQDDAKTCYATMLKKTDGRIDWNKNALEIDRQIRALNPWPSTYSTINGAVFKIGAASIIDDFPIPDNAIIGQILDRKGHVLCGDRSVLQIKLIQPENKKMMDFTAALNGGYINFMDCFA